MCNCKAKNKTKQPLKPNIGNTSKPKTKGSVIAQFYNNE